MTSTGRLDEKVVVISGGSQGMGAAFARRFIAEGAKVLIGDILENQGEALAEELGSAARFRKLDVTNGEEWKTAVGFCEAELGFVNVLVNNAGIFGMNRLEDISENEFRRFFEVNQLGCLLGMQAAIPSMRRAQGGSIVNVSSVAGFAGSPLQTSYVASKFAIRGMTKVAALELCGDNIRVNSVHPGGVETPMTGFASQPVRLPVKRFAKPDEISHLMVYLASDESEFCTGSEFVIDGGYLATVGRPSV